MLRCLYTAATGMDAQQLQMDVISNNLANASTTGFKKTRANFEDLLSDTIRGASAPAPAGGTDPTPLQVGLGVRTGSTTHAFGQGDLITTNNPTDVAIQGSGFFRVQLPNGDYAYTRAGNFTVDATDPTINADGTVTVLVPGRSDPSEPAQTELYTFTNPVGLKSLGNNLF